MPIDKEVVKARINELIGAINELKRLTSKPFIEMNIDEVYSMRYNIIVLAESLASICLHLALEFYGMRPRSNTECVREVCQRINLYCCKDLEDLIRLRNIITHRYWMVKDDQIYRDIKNDFECIFEFIRKVEELSSV